MDFESPDVEKDFPGLYASETTKRSQSRDSDYSDDEKLSRKDLLGKKRERKESKKDKGYVAFEGESSGDEIDETKSPSKSKKNKSSAFKFPGKDKKEKHNKVKEKEFKDKKEEKEKVVKKESKEIKKEKESKDSDKLKDKKIKKKKESKLLKIKDRKKKDQEIVEEKPIFGVPLQVAVERSKSHDGIELPIVVRECIDYIEEHGLACEGIYRISGLKSKLRQLKSQYNRGEKVYLYEHEPHIVASLLKQFLRDLPEPILTSELTPKFEEAADLKDKQKRAEVFEKLLNNLPTCNRLLLSWIFVHMLHVVSFERRNKMNLQNVSIVLSPTMQISHRVLHALFSHSTILFKDVELKKYVPPIELDTSRLSLELPDSPSAIAEELSRQENVLNKLHAELNAGLRDKQKEEQLWEIQRIVTQLKRKLRFLKQVQDASKYTSEDVNGDNKNLDSCDFNANTENLKITENTVTAESTPVSEKQDKNIKEKEVGGGDANEKHSETAADEAQQKSTDPLSNEDMEKEMKTEAPCVEDELKDDVVAVSLEDEHKEETNSIAESKTMTAVNNVPENESPSDENMDALIHEEIMLHLQQDELLLLRDELRRKVNSEKMEIERLRSEINEYQQLYKYKQYSFDSTENSSSESDDSSASEGDDEEDLTSTLDDLIIENKALEMKNYDLSKEIQREREACIKIKVQVKMLQSEAKYMRL